MSRLEEFYQQHVQQAQHCESQGNVSLALREWREARRLRPHHPLPPQQIARLEQLGLAELPSPSLPSLSAVAASFNLTVRYWDKGEGGFALAEARKCQELFEKSDTASRHGLGCIGHNLAAILKVPSPKSTAGYAEALRLFDRRMLGACERKLVQVEQELRLKRRDLSGVKDDLAYVRQLQRAADNVSAEVPLLPCLLSRFAEVDCDSWRKRLGTDWN